jgi:release factor glutamine methyltransferase
MNAPLPFAPGLRVVAARRALARMFRQAGIDTPELDARVLLQSELGLTHAEVTAAGDRALAREAIDRLSRAAARRLRREPVALITGRKEFWDLPLRVTPATLIPRPDSETVVEAALRATVDAGPRERVLLIADLGTGSGALLLALLSELPNALGVATDVSVAALAVAADNARRLLLAERTRFVGSDFGAALAGGFDLVVSNPPYVESGAIATLAPEVRDHDPRIALDGGPDGLAAYRAIAADARRLLAPSGCLVLELGRGQSEAVAALLAAAGLAIASLREDIAGVPRALVARRA